MDPLSIIASTIAVVQATATAYNVIQKLRGLPKEFSEVNRNLPLAEDTLRLAENQLKGQTLDEASKAALEPCVSGCEAKATKLRDIFREVGSGVRKAKDGTVLDFYRTALLRVGKAHRVEKLMQDILRDLNALATNQLFRTATQSLVTDLQKAIDQLSKVVSSLPDSDFEGPVINATQNNASGASGHQSVISGQDHKINSGSGKQYNAQTMNLGRFMEDRKAQILQTLHTSPYRDRMNRNPPHVPGTCEWFVCHDYFKRWRENKSSSMLWVSANPGCGKSVLAKHLVDSVLQTTESRTTCYFFFKDDFDDQKSAAGALCCILHQIFTKRKDLYSDKIVEQFEAHIIHLTSSFDELWDALVAVSQYQSAGEIACILDAFDECADDERRKLASALCKFYDPGNDMKKRCNLKFLVTSRPYDKIRQDFLPLNIPDLPVIHLKAESEGELSKIAQEIIVYIEYKVSHMQDLKEEEKRLLLQKLQGIPNRTYIWVDLTIAWIKSVINQININIKISEVTSALPRTADEAYDKILDKSSDSREAKKLLHIIVAATRPLTLAETSLALFLRQYHSSYEDWDGYRNWDDISEERFRRHVRDLCGLFVNMIDSKIYLLHQTAKEFLVPKLGPDPQEDNTGLQEANSRGSHNGKLKWKSSLQPAESHSTLCQICIRHLLFTEFETGPLHENPNGSVADYVRDHVFLEYSATNWATHFRASGIEEDAVMESLRQICVSSSTRFRTWFRIYWATTQTGISPGFTTLMVASYFGLELLVKHQLESDDVEVDFRDGAYQRSALSWAAENGFDGVVKLLIKGPSFCIKKAFTKPWTLKGAKVDTRDKHGRTPLSYAALNGHMATIKLLVKEKARVVAEDDIGGTPIYYALCTGHEDIAKEMLKGGQVGSVDDIRRNLVLSAAKAGHETVVKLLAENGADVEVRDADGKTPLSLAAAHGQVAIVKLLTENGADVEVRDTDGKTPLSLAAAHGQVAVARLLINAGADINAKEKGGHTPLTRAIDSGSADTIEVLLESSAEVNYSFRLSWSEIVSELDGPE